MPGQLHGKEKKNHSISPRGLEGADEAERGAERAGSGPGSSRQRCSWTAPRPPSAPAQGRKPPTSLLVPPRVPREAERAQAAGCQLLVPHPCGLWQVTQAEAATRGHARTVTFTRRPGARRRHSSAVCLRVTHSKRAHVSNPGSSLNIINPQTELAGSQPPAPGARRALSASPSRAAPREGFVFSSAAFSSFIFKPHFSRGDVGGGSAPACPQTSPNGLTVTAKWASQGLWEPS